MITIHHGMRAPAADPAFAAMFEDRKRLFVDLFRWEVPVVEERYEIDRFDDAHATYLIASAPGAAHIGSMRLLPTTRPHLLDTLFHALCDRAVPVGPDTYEITRLCLPSRLGAARRLGVRNALISAMVDHALGAGITAFTGVVASGFLVQVLAMGWRGQALGRPRTIGGSEIGAFRIEIDAGTPAALERTGIYTSPAPAAARAAA